jgi:hypothetical protein
MPRIVTVLASVMLLVAAAACESNNPTFDIEEAELTTVVAKNQTPNDTVWGSDNTLEVTDSAGVVWRWERDGADGAWTEARLYRDGVLQGTWEYVWSGSTLEGFRWKDGTDWMDTDLDGDIEDTSGGRGPCPDPNDPDCVVVEFWGHNCDDEYDEMQTAAWYAAGSAGVAALLTSATGGAPIFSVPSILTAAAAGGNAIARLGIWISCKVT